jgi:ABC-type branched-subunit amino acid transport system permease subunit
LGQMNVLIFGIVFILTILFLPEGLIGLMKRLQKAKRFGLSGRLRDGSI